MNKKQILKIWEDYLHDWTWMVSCVAAGVLLADFIKASL